MKHTTFLFVMIFLLVPMPQAQNMPTQTPGSGTSSQTGSEHHQQMMEMHKKETAAMKADVEKMKASLAAMKANLASISDQNEMARWRNNVDLWQTVVEHMEQMQRHMESMGPGTKHGPGMMHDRVTGASQSPPSEKKPN